MQDGIDFVARRNLKANEELTFDSCATDWRDFSALPKEAQTNIDAADHLVRRLTRISAPHAAIRDIVRDCVATPPMNVRMVTNRRSKAAAGEYAAAEVYWNQGGDYFSSPSFLSPFAQACVARRLLCAFAFSCLGPLDACSMAWRVPSRPRDAIDATLDTSHRAGAAGSPKAVKAQLRQVDALQREFLVSRREGDLRRTCLHAVCAGAVLLKTSDADYAGVIKELCDNGADPNAKDVLGRAPVFCLARSPSSEALEPKALDFWANSLRAVCESWTLHASRMVDFHAGREGRRHQHRRPGGHESAICALLLRRPAGRRRFIETGRGPAPALPLLRRDHASVALPSGRDDPHGSSRHSSSTGRGGATVRRRRAFGAIAANGNKMSRLRGEAGPVPEMFEVQGRPLLLRRVPEVRLAVS